MIMILTKLDSKVTLGQPIIYLYCVPLLINKGAFQSRCIYVLLILQSHLTTLIDQHFTINYCSNRGIDGNFLNVMKSMFSKTECRVKWDKCISDILKSEFGSWKVVPNYSQNVFRLYPNHFLRSGDPSGYFINGILVKFADDLVFFFRFCRWTCLQPYKLVSMGVNVIII